MLSADLLKKIRLLEIKTRKVVTSVFSGEYHSVFKGQGINFSEVRDYSPGDDIRRIDWNVTARTGRPHVKVYEEERELTVVLAVDLSASQRFGSSEKTKREIAAEIAAIIGFSATINNDKVGLLLFTDRVERFIPPKKGKSHVLHILSDIFSYHPVGQSTSIGQAMEYLLRAVRRKAIVFIISDFMDEGFEPVLKMAAIRHDIVPIMLEDPLELSISRTGMWHLEDNETGERMWLNMYSEPARRKFEEVQQARKDRIRYFFQSIGCEPIPINVGESYLMPLMTYFKKRATRY